MGSIYVICSRQCPNGDGIYTLLYALYKYSTSITNRPTKVNSALSIARTHRGRQHPHQLRYLHITWLIEVFSPNPSMPSLAQAMHILPPCTTATAHTLAFEFDLVMDFMAIFSSKQAEVSTGVKTYDTTVYKGWKHVAWSKHVVKLWQYVEHPTGRMSFAWHSFDHHSNKDKQHSPTTIQWPLKPQQKTNLFSVSLHSTISYH